MNKIKESKIATDELAVGSSIDFIIKLIKRHFKNYSDVTDSIEFQNAFTVKFRRAGEDSLTDPIAKIRMAVKLDRVLFLGVLKSLGVGM